MAEWRPGHTSANNGARLERRVDGLRALEGSWQLWRDRGRRATILGATTGSLQSGTDRGRCRALLCSVAGVSGRLSLEYAFPPHLPGCAGKRVLLRSVRRRPFCSVFGPACRLAALAVGAADSRHHVRGGHCPLLFNGRILRAGRRIERGERRLTAGEIRELARYEVRPESLEQWPSRLCG